MSKRTEMFARIAAAMPEDVEVQEWMAKELERAGRSAAKTQERLDMALQVIKGHAVKAVCAKDFAHEINLAFGTAQNWNTRTAAYYLRQLVLKGMVEEVPYEEKKTGPKMYLYVG